MRDSTSDRRWPAWSAGFLILLALLLAGFPAYGQVIKVTSAVPDAADQGTVGLVVTVGGENFASGAKVAFYVTGTTNPGGIAVKGVKFKDSKTLEATIDVAPDAQTELKFDVQVKCGGRTGKGTELFSVRVKSTGGSIPPGSVTDLSVTVGEYNGLSVSYTAPADDGYDAASGPVNTATLWLRACGPHTASTVAGERWQDPCYVMNWGKREPGAPGATVTSGPYYLGPDTDYWAMIRVADHTNPTRLESPLEEDLLHQVSFRTGPAPITPWTTETVYACPPLTPPNLPPLIPCAASGYLAFDPSATPWIIHGGVDGGWRISSREQNVWQSEPVWDGVGSVLGLAFDDSGVLTTSYFSGKLTLTFARRTGATPQAWDTEVATHECYGLGEGRAYATNSLDGSPTIFYEYAKTRNTCTLRVAERRNGTWASEDAIPGCGGRRLYNPAFDAAGNPATIYGVEGGGGWVALEFAARENGAWLSETIVDASTIGPDWTIDSSANLAFDPYRRDFAVVFRARHLPYFPSSYRTYYCERTAGSWSCQPLMDPSFWITGARLGIGADGTVYVAHGEGFGLFVALRKPGQDWTREYVSWGVGSINLEADPAGGFAISIHADHDDTGMGTSYSVKFARRSPAAP